MLFSDVNLEKFVHTYEPDESKSKIVKVAFKSTSKTSKGFTTCSKD
jgi:hypothetical protein